MKVSIRFFEDKEVRAVWNDEKSCWYFSVVDIVGILNEQEDYAKTRNYWKYLKNKLKNKNNELVSATNQLKLTAPDGKKRLTDVLEAMEESVIDSSKIKKLLENALTDKINDRETFMKGIDYSSYYEET